MAYEQIYKVIELYHQYKGMLNDDGTLADDAQIAALIHPSVEEDIDEEKLDELATNWWLDDSKISYAKDAYTKLYTGKTLMYAFKEGYRKAKEE